MAREQVVKVQCDRCKRMELQPAVADKTGPDFEASFSGKKLVYGDLCQRCRDAIDNIWKDLAEWDREVKYTTIRNGPVVNKEMAAPLQTAPNFSPPQPHSAAAVKR